MFATIINGQLAKKSFVTVSYKNICEEFLKVLWEEGFILGYSLNFNKKKINILLKYKNDKPVINKIKTITKPSFRTYYSARQILLINSSKNFIIFSTNKGLMTLDRCKKLKIGGEPYISIN